MASRRINRGKYLHGIKQVLVNICDIVVAKVLLKGIKEGGSFKETILSTLSSLL